MSCVVLTISSSGKWRSQLYGG